MVLEFGLFVAQEPLCHLLGSSALDARSDGPTTVSEAVTSASTTHSEWDLVTFDGSPQEKKDRLHSTMYTAIKGMRVGFHFFFQVMGLLSFCFLSVICVAGFGGPRQYLQAMYPADSDRKAFYTWISHEIGEDPTVLYARQFGDIPVVEPNCENEAGTAIPVWCFSFSSEAGLTGPPELDKSHGFIGKLLAYGFTSGDEPVRLRIPVFWLQDGSMCRVKLKKWNRPTDSI